MDPNDLIAEAAMELLREHGPQTAADWGKLLADAGHGTPDDMTEFVEYVEDPLLGYLTGARYAALDTLFEHRILTHRLTDAEISSGVLDANPDLMVLRVFLDSFDDAEDREIRVVHRGLDDAALAERGIDDPTFPADEGFLLAPDALSECSAGDLIGLFVADRELTLCTVAEVVDPTPGFADVLASILTDTGAETLDAIVWQLMPSRHCSGSPRLRWGTARIRRLRTRRRLRRNRRFRFRGVPLGEPRADARDSRQPAPRRGSCGDRTGRSGVGRASRIPGRHVGNR